MKRRENMMREKDGLKWLMVQWPEEVDGMSDEYQEVLNKE